MPSPLINLAKYQSQPSNPATWGDLYQFYQSMGRLAQNAQFVQLNLSDSTVYDPITFTLTIPEGVFNGVYQLNVDLYSTLTTYVENNIVRSDGTHGGTTGYTYIAVLPALYDDLTAYAMNDKVSSDGTHGGVDGLQYTSLANANTGNDLDDATKWAVTTNLNRALNNTDWWALVDAAGGAVGNIEVVYVVGTIDGQICKFQGVESFFTAFIASAIATLAATELATTAGSTVRIEGRTTVGDYIQFLTDSNGCLAQIGGFIYTT